MKPMQIIILINARVMSSMSAVNNYISQKAETTCLIRRVEHSRSSLGYRAPMT